MTRLRQRSGVLLAWLDVATRSVRQLEGVHAGPHARQGDPCTRASRRPTHHDYEVTHD